MLLPPSGLTSAAVVAAVVVSEAVLVVVLRCPPPGLSRANWSRRWWLRHPRQSSQYWPSISYSRHTFLNRSLKQTHNIFSEFWSLKREYIGIGLDWSFDNIGELCSTLYPLTNIPSVITIHKFPISRFRLRAGAEFPHNFSDERMSPAAASHHTWEYQQRRDNLGRHPSCHLSALHDVTD